MRKKSTRSKAEPLFRRALEASEPKLGHNPPDTMTSVNNLGVLRKAQGRLDQADPLYRRTFKGMEVKFGRDQPHTVVSTNNLGLVLTEQGTLDEDEDEARAFETRESRPWRAPL